MKPKNQKAASRSFLESFAEAAGLNRLKKTDVPRLYYLSGAVTHDPHYRLKFDLAERYLIAKGNCVINPIRNESAGLTWEQYLSADLLILERMKTIYANIVMIDSKLSGGHLPLPAIAMIDPEDRQFPSKGASLENAFAGTFLPVVNLGKTWNSLLTKAIEEAEKEAAR